LNFWRRIVGGKAEAESPYFRPQHPNFRSGRRNDQAEELDMDVLVADRESIHRIEFGAARESSKEASRTDGGHQLSIRGVDIERGLAHEQNAWGPSI
jgi:hypothetical protein